MFDFAYDKQEVIKTIGLENESEEYQQEVLSNLEQQLDERMRDYILNNLSPEQQDAFGKLQSRDEGQAFLREAVPNIEELYEDEFEMIVEDAQVMFSS